MTEPRAPYRTCDGPPPPGGLSDSYRRFYGIADRYWERDGLGGPEQPIEDATMRAVVDRLWAAIARLERFEQRSRTMAAPVQPPAARPSQPSHPAPTPAITGDLPDFID